MSKQTSTTDGGNGIKNSIWKKIIKTANELVSWALPINFKRLIQSITTNGKGFAGIIEIFTAFLTPLRLDILFKEIVKVWTNKK